MRFASTVFLGILLSSLTASASVTLAGEADVEKVKISKESAGSYRFDVTVRHDDKGWDHYANKWEVVAPDGKVLGTRILAHPHDTEQPFTRSLGGVKIPAGVEKVRVRAYDSVHGAGGTEQEVVVPK